MARSETNLFDDVDDAAEAEADARAEADVEAGRTVTHKAMKAWLLSWGTKGETPPPGDGQ